MGRCFASCCNSTRCTQTTRFTSRVLGSLWKEVYASALGRPLDIIHKRVVRLSVSSPYKTNLVFETFHVSIGFSLHIFGANLLDAHVLDTHIRTVLSSSSAINLRSQVIPRPPAKETFGEPLSYLRKSICWDNS